MGITAKKIHFIGIGGIGMSGLARIVLGFNVKCSGSDVMESSLIADLRELGAIVNIGHSATNITDDIDMVVYSSAIKASNPELIKAYDNGIKVIGRGELLAILMQEQKGIAIAGAHGKTSTTGMMGTMFRECQLDPSIIIGGTLPYIGSNACWGSGEYLVAEADESDGSFLKLNPHIAVINNVENDHLDHYGDMEHLIAAFGEFAENVPEDGCVAFGIDNKICEDLSKEHKGAQITFAINNQNADVIAKNIRYIGEGTISDIYYQNNYLGELKLNKPGEYNVLNALACLAVGLHLKVNFAEMTAGLAVFSGTGRRFEKLGEDKSRNILVIDDYAHHPTELVSVLDGAKKLPYNRLIGVFQPHRYSRTQMLAEEFGRAFNECDIVIIAAIYAAFEKPIEGVSGMTVVEEVRKNTNKEVIYAKDLEEVTTLLGNIVENDDIVMIMGAGNIYQAGKNFVSEYLNKN